MSDIKFACPHCEQHIACDEIYCGERIACPGCGGFLFVPPLAAGVPLRAGNLALRMPVAAREKVLPHPAPPDAWTRSDWERYESGTGSASWPWLLGFWVLLILPFFLALLALKHRENANTVMIGFLVCAPLAGFCLAKLHGKAALATVLIGFLYSVGVLMMYGVLSLGLLFVGCLLS